MGWFWAEGPAKPSSTPLVAPHPIPQSGATPPPECPMHKPNQPSPLRQRIEANKKSSTPPLPSSAASSCPVKSPSQAARYPTSPDVPIDSPQKAPSSWSATLNPLNYMPTFKNERSSDSPQSVNLPLERELSTIPRGDSDSNWEYPSPQQMYNAMLRKGHTDTPAEDVESMVAVHNFLNEGAWNEIVEWENIFAKGLGQGWEKCKRGEQGLAMERARREYLRELQAERRRAAGLPEDKSLDTEQPRLLRFQGRPQEPTPKARILQQLAKTFPNRFGQEPPFDRHDWYVARKQADGSIKEVRYVIDYYGGGLQATGEPVFYLDIRPALDTPTAAAERVIRWGSDVWYTATGSGIREQIKQQEAQAKAKA
ncbi:holocytochrome c synthase [Lithohypha guttulata]|uniref:Holocytochrome c-type synthase n=1 Tax=Lithohypha guttulata TaxID=1690604 RepID=A0AAN7SU41_9EURO|nr:holocytochrome c synthase [Lithohypha guttulata]KAK5081525.1 holocytochrome c synthase [Lithohypha guttulata]